MNAAVSSVVFPRISRNRLKLLCAPKKMIGKNPTKLARPPMARPESPKDFPTAVGTQTSIERARILKLLIRKSFLPRTPPVLNRLVFTLRSFIRSPRLRCYFTNLKGIGVPDLNNELIKIYLSLPWSQYVFSKTSTPRTSEFNVWSF